VALLPSLQAFLVDLQAPSPLHRLLHLSGLPVDGTQEIQYSI